MFSGYLDRELPPELSDLTELALDLRWTTSRLTRRVWERLDRDAWEQCENPYLVLLNVSQDRLEAAARDEQLLHDLAHWREKRKEYETAPTWYTQSQRAAALKGVAYFSMEFGLTEGLPIYSGGLGMLAGDHLKSASDLGVPLIGVGILYQQGYFRQLLSDDGSQREAFPYNDPSSLPVSPVRHDGRWQRVELELPGRTLYLRVWQARIGRVPLYLLDSNDPLNSFWDRGITANLYDAGRDKRLLQEIVLGIGGWRLLDELGLEIDVCHLNEGHAAFAVLARAASFAKRTGVPIPAAFRACRAGNVFTTHTPVAAAFDEFDASLIAHYAQPFLETLDLPTERLLAFGRSNPDDAGEPFNMAFLAMRGCCHVNGVSRLHGRVSQGLFTRLYPGWSQAEVPVGAITNGVHVPTWNSAAARKLWVDTSASNAWLSDLGGAAEAIPSCDLVELWNMRAEARQTLVEYVRRRLKRQLQIRGVSAEAVREAGHVLDPNALTLGFARRFTEYKRPTLLLRDPARLQRLLLNPLRPVQLIVAGKAHPNDGFGKEMVRTMAQFAMQRQLRSHVVFLEDYDMVLAQHFATGIDVWLNTPRRPAEACGTSGMKMLFNGGLNLSVRDGWWDEAFSPEVGWEIGGGEEDDPINRDAREADQLYTALEQQVVPEFYDRDEEGVPHSWLRRIQASMAQLTPRFGSDRMVKDYVEQAYLPAAEAIGQRVADGARVARELYDWHLQLEEHWRGMHFGEVRVTESDTQRRFSIAVYLGELAADAVRVELFADSFDGGQPTVIPMQRDHPVPGAVNAFVFVAETDCDRPAEHYTPRIVPWHPAAFVPSEEAWIFWKS